MSCFGCGFLLIFAMLLLLLFRICGVAIRELQRKLGMVVRLLEFMIFILRSFVFVFVFVCLFG